MMNPIALTTIALGVLLFLIGIVLITKRMKIAGIVVLFLGAGIVAFPFVSSYYLGPNP